MVTQRITRISFWGFVIICIILAAIFGVKIYNWNCRQTSNYEQICQTDYTRMNYSDGYYYYQSSADHFYLYKSDEEGKERECLAKQVPKEIYVKEDWIYFTNVSDKQTLYRIHTDGSNMEQVLEKQIDRFIFIGDIIYYLSKEDGNLYSWKEGVDSRLLYQGDCRWLGTDGKIPYISVCEMEGEEEKFFYISIDANGKLQSKFAGFRMIPTEEYLYDVDGAHIVRISTATGEAIELAQIPKQAEYESVIDFALWKGDLYVLCYQWEKSYVIYQYKTSENKLEVLYTQMLEDSDHVYRGFEDFHIKNGKIFMKEMVSEGKGELWCCLDIASGEKSVFEDMEPFSNIDLPLNEDVFCGATQESSAYLAQDYVYEKTIEDEEGNLIKTDIVIPQINENIEAYQEINKKIKNDAELFHKEQIEFAEYIKGGAAEWEKESCGNWKYVYVYADANYVSIVYWKFIGRNGLDDIKDDHYEVRLYSSKTGEEISIEDLFCVDIDQVLLRLSFAIRKTESGLRMFNDDLEMLERHNSDYMISYYLLKEEGIDVFFVERVRTGVFHYIISYEELEDIMIVDNTQADVPETVEENCKEMDFESSYQLLNQDLFGKSSVQWLDDALKQEIFLYAEEVKGEFAEVQNEKSIFPAELISALEKMIYQSLDSTLHKFTWEEIQESIYFETIREFGAEDFKLDLEEIKNLFPAALENSGVENVYDAYRLVSGEENCEEMFHFQMADGQDNYVLVINSGGSAGIVSVKLTKRVGDEFIVISEFETQNSGYGRVIQFDEDFYYIFLEYNYNLKNYDGVRIYKLGENAERENLKIKYLPDDYVWKNIYDTFEGEELDDYIESIKEDITSDKYLESGKTDGAAVFYGDEEKAEGFIVPENEKQYAGNEYYRIDFANIGVPVYIRKSGFIPSNRMTIWHLKSSFYLQNSEDDSITELDKLEIGYLAPLAGEISLVQMWFKAIEGEAYTCCLYHVSDYNYVLSIFRMEGDKINRVRTDMICPYRQFVLNEGEVYHY